MCFCLLHVVMWDNDYVDFHSKIVRIIFFVICLIAEHEELCLCSLQPTRFTLWCQSAGALVSRFTTPFLVQQSRMKTKEPSLSLSTLEIPGQISLRSMRRRYLTNQIDLNSICKASIVASPLKIWAAARNIYISKAHPIHPYQYEMTPVSIGETIPIRMPKPF